MPYGFDFPTPQGYVDNPIMQDMMARYLMLFQRMPNFQSFMQQRVGPMQDILSNQAVQARSGIGSHLAARGMGQSGAYGAALGGIEQGRMSALAQMMPSMQQLYQQQQMQLLGGASQAGSQAFMPQIQQPNPFWGALGGALGMGLPFLGGPMAGLFGNLFGRGQQRGTPLWFLGEGP